MKPRDVRWFKPWQDMGFRLIQSKRNHLKVYDGDHLVASVSCSPSNITASRLETERIIRRYQKAKGDKA